MSAGSTGHIHHPRNLAVVRFADAEFTVGANAGVRLEGVSEEQHVEPTASPADDTPASGIWEELTTLRAGRS